MKRRLIAFAFLAASLALAPGLKALDMSLGHVTNNNVPTGQLFAVSTASPLTYVASTLAGPGISIKKLLFSCNVVSFTAMTTVQLLDSPDGKSLTAGTRALTPPLYALLPQADKPYIWDFQLPDGSDRAGGIFCKGFPILVETGTNTPNAQIQYLKGPGNAVLPGTAAGVVPH